MSRRRKAREAVLKSLYAHESVGGDPQSFLISVLEEIKMDDRTTKFASDLYQIICTNMEKIDSEIVHHAQRWDISRVALIDKNIMRIAICEMLYFPDIPSKVSINEAIEMAKKFSTDESAGFVNGILNAVFKQHETELET